MKTPDSIKKGLELCGVLDGDCENCPYDDGPQLLCADRLRKDALAYIRQLESRLAHVERERDAAVHDMKQCQSAVCNACKRHYRPNPDVRHYECALLGKFSDIFDSDDDRPFICGKFEWRGVCAENTEEASP